MPQYTLKERFSRYFQRLFQLFAKHSEDNPFLSGPYAPVDDESSVTELAVEGSIPTRLNGIFARIGPNPMDVSNPGKHHWFAGDGMVHGLRVKAGEALWYKSRWVGTDDVNKRLGKPALPGQRHGIDRVVNTNIVGHAGSLWALVEAGALPVQMNADLESLKHGLFFSDNKQSYTAHPHLDPTTGELHAVCYDALEPKQIRYVVTDNSGQVSHQAVIPVKHGPMIHDCALTAKHAVVLDLPITFSVKQLLQGYKLPYQWNPKHQARVGLIPRHGSAADIRWYEVGPCYVFHTANAFELENGDVVMDVIAYSRMFYQSKLGPENHPSTLERWLLPANGRQVQRQVISSNQQEFPRINEHYATQPYQYVYSIGVNIDAPDQGQPVYKYDVNTGEQWQYHFGQHCIPSEVIFVANDTHTKEDDGWLLAYVYNIQTQQSSVVILRADDLASGPIATITLPVRVPLGFHANWIALSD